jgi:bifunctional enzyme CysN/CysC
MNVHWQPLTITKELRASLKQQRPCVIWLTGLSGSGKSTLANLVEGWLALRGCHTYLLDGDNVRHGLNKDLGFTAVDRVENIRRVGEVARLFVDAGVIVLCSFISPFRAEREAVRSLLDNGEFIEIHVTAPLEVCEARDPKGLYAKCRAGQLPNFTGIDSPYEAPENADLVLDTTTAPATELAHRIVSLLQARGIVADDNARERVGRIP